MTAVRVRITSTREARGSLARASMLVARALSLPLRESAPLLEHSPARLPLALAQAAGEELVRELGQLGVTAEIEPVAGIQPRCPAHPAFEADEQCSVCDAKACSLCILPRGESGARPCTSCDRRAARKRRFFRLRVTILLGALCVTIAYAAAELRSRGDRRTWDEPLVVAIVWLTPKPVDPAALQALTARIPALEDHLAAELARYRDGDVRPFQFVVYGPVPVTDSPPSDPGDGIVDLARFNYDLWSYGRSVDEAADLQSKAFDARLYVVVHDATTAEMVAIEGLSQHGGTVGTASVDLNPNQVDFPLFVIAHELFHLVGAEDKYDETGKPLLPAGLAEPARTPLFPQQYVEVMSRSRPITEVDDALPSRLDELRVGPVTAREVGWARPP